MLFWEIVEKGKPWCGWELFRTSTNQNAHLFLFRSSVFARPFALTETFGTLLLEFKRSPAIFNRATLPLPPMHLHIFVIIIQLTQSTLYYRHLTRKGQSSRTSKVVRFRVGLRMHDEVNTNSGSSEFKIELAQSTFELVRSCIFLIHFPNFIVKIINF